MGINPKECIGSGVYVIKCQNYYKIGSTYDLSRRIKSLKTGSPFEFEIVKWIYRPNKGLASSLEETLHLVFKKKRVCREWYDLDYEDFETLTIYDFRKESDEDPDPDEFNEEEVKRPTLPFHPDWYYWNWFAAYEPWKVSQAKERRMRI
jgi:hypothetical protein